MTYVVTKLEYPVIVMKVEEEGHPYDGRYLVSIDKVAASWCRDAAAADAWAKEHIVKHDPERDQ